MQIRRVGSAHVYRPVHIPAVTSAEGGLVSPARTDVREHDVQVDLGSGVRANFTPPRPTDLNVFSNVAPSSAGAGAGRQSQGQGQGRQGSHRQDSTIVVTDQLTEGSAQKEKPQSGLGKLFGAARKLFDF